VKDESIIMMRPDGRQLPETYLLSKGYRGKFVMKVTIDMGKKVSGKRITVPFRTSDESVALHKRDGALEVLRVLGIHSRDVVILEVGQFSDSTEPGSTPNLKHP
jgi:hypothetical protein